MIKFLILIISSIFLGIVYVINKFVVEEKYSPSVYVSLFAYINSVLLLPFLFYDFSVPNDIKYWLIALISICSFGIASYYMFKAYSFLDATEVGIIGKLNLLLVVVFGIFFLKEKFLFISFIGLLLIILGNIILIYNKYKLKLNKGVLYTLFMVIGVSLATILDKIVIQHFSVYSYMFLNNFIMGIFFSFRKNYFRNIVSIWNDKRTFILLNSIFAVLAWLGFLFVLKSMKVSIVYPIFEGLSLITTFILSYLILKEKNNVFVKIIGAVLTIIGIYLLY